jgi:predicted RNA polymerase sigma factor
LDADRGVVRCAIAAHAFAGRGAQSRRRTGLAFGPAAGLEVIDGLRADPALAGYHLLPSVRGDLLAKLGRVEEARAELQHAAALTRNVRERNVLLKKMEALS